MDGNKKRFFAFGCSYTSHITATWADFIGVNFEEYYNFGKPGACNTFIMNKFVEANAKYNFVAETDVIVVMLTSMSRFSYYDNIGWKLQGNVHNNTNIPEFKDKMWSEDWGIYNSWIAINIIKNIIKYKNLDCTVLCAFDNSSIYLDNPFDDIITNQISFKYLKNFENLLDDSEPLEIWKNKNYTYPSDFYKWDDISFVDAHPTQQMHYDFVKEKFPKYNTEKTKEFLELVESIFDNKSSYNQGVNYNEKIYKVYNLAAKANLF
jgi:hypothetical protein